MTYLKNKRPRGEIIKKTTKVRSVKNILRKTSPMLLLFFKNSGKSRHTKNIDFFQT